MDERWNKKEFSIPLQLYEEDKLQVQIVTTPVGGRYFVLNLVIFSHYQKFKYQPKNDEQGRQFLFDVLTFLVDLHAQSMLIIHVTMY